MLITIDIETIPTENAEAIASIAAEISPPKTMSKAETIAKWEAEDKPGVVKQQVLKTSFDGTCGRILCVGWAIDDTPPNHSIGAEAEVLEAFLADIQNVLPESRYDPSAIFIGHNLTGFDLRFLWQRCVINKIKLPPTLNVACKAKPWDKCVADTMLMWHPDREKRISLDRLCKALGVPTSKGDMDGSKVYETYLAGNLAKIGAYCMDDVVATRECYKRMMFL